MGRLEDDPVKAIRQTEIVAFEWRTKCGEQLPDQNTCCIEVQVECDRAVEVKEA
jgi:hypothetical protein